MSFDEPFTHLRRPIVRFTTFWLYLGNPTHFVSLPGVFPLVLLEITSGGELLIAAVILAIKGLARVYPFVRFQSVERVERLITALFDAGVWLLSCVNSAMDFQSVGGEKGFVAAVKVALVVEFALVRLEVHLQVTLGGVGTITAIIHTFVPFGCGSVPVHTFDRSG